MDIFEYGNKSAGIVLIQPVGDHETSILEKEVEQIRTKTDKDFMLAAFHVSDWNKELSPWKAPAVFGNEDFGNGASDTLMEIVKYCNDIDKIYYIGGYSLAGLFSLWAVYNSDIFSGACAVSPSMWFPGFTEYMRGNKLGCGNVYLSLGDKEEKTRNSVMATVGDKIREAYTILRNQNFNCTLEWNQGNHFKEPDVRTSKGFTWLIQQKRQHPDI